MSAPPPLPHTSCSARAGNALNWVPLIGLGTLLPFIDEILPIAQSVEDQYKAYFASAQDAEKQRQQISTLISSNEMLIAQLNAQITSNEGEVLSIQADLFTLNTNRNIAKDALQVSAVRIAPMPPAGSLYMLRQTQVLASLNTVCLPGFGLLQAYIRLRALPQLYAIWDLKTMCHVSMSAGNKLSSVCLLLHQPAAAFSRA